MKKGDNYGFLTAIQLHHKIKWKPFWLFKCICGNTHIALAYAVSSGNTKSCGCLAKPHGEARLNNETKEHRIWRYMRHRCHCATSSDYKNYGGRGITLCKEWDNYKTFLKDMGRCPKNCTIDRVDNEKGYFKENCRWATHKEQCNNYRYNVMISYKGKMQSVKMWSEEYHISYAMLLARVHAGWDFKKSLLTPSLRYKTIEV